MTSSSPKPEPQRVSYSLRAKVTMTLVLAAGIGCFVLAGLSAVTDSDPSLTVSGASAGGADEVGVQAFVPGRGDEVLAQSKIGIDLGPGWTGELLLLPSNGTAVVLPEDELERTSLNEILYQPGPGRTIERLAGGPNCVAASIWDQVRGRSGTERVVQWCFDVV